MIIFQIIEFFAAFTEALLGISINAKTLEGESYKVKENIIASFMIAFMIWLLNQVWIFSAVTTIVGIMGIVISSRIIYKTKIYDSIALTAVYLLLVYIIDFLSMALFGVVVKDTQFANAVTSELSYARLCYLILDKVLLCAVYFILEKKCLTKMQMPIRKLGVGIILTGVMVYILIKNTFMHIDSNTFFVWFFFLLFVIAVIYLAIQIMSYIDSNNRMTMAMAVNSLLASNYKKEIQKYQNEQIFYHDLKNQFVVIENYMRNKKFDKAEEYIGRLNSAEVVLPTRRTGIEVLDVLLEYKKKEAEEQKIHVDIMAESIELRLMEHEIIALFGNLLDNAIEACNQLHDDIRWIRVAVRRMQEMTFIKISNSYVVYPILEQEKFVSTKSDKMMHGLGMTSMRMIVEKYDGDMEVDYNSENFTVMISFFH